jgi:hypothetical protein
VQPVRHLRSPAATCTALLLLLVLAPSCSAYRHGGWREAPAASFIEFQVVDRNIPADPLSDTKPRPPTCDLEVLLDDEVAISTALHPTGESPPYSIESSFRIPASAVQHDVTIYYSSCRTHGLQLDSLDAQVTVVVSSGGLTRIEFDGSSVFAFPPRMVPASR